MHKVKVMIVFGTRPEAIKMAPLIIELKRQVDYFDVTTVVTAQHREMLDQVLDIFNIVPDYDLNLMRQKQSLQTITTNVITEFSKVLKEKNPDLVLVHGDTTTTFAASVSAYYEQIPVGHVEAGLRTWNKYSPFPEELNRQMTDDIAEMYFAPTNTSKNNLISENHDEKKIYITGNTAIDALKNTISNDYHHDIISNIDKKHRIILVTMHRRENQGKPMANAFTAMREVVNTNDDVEIIYPMHLNPVVRDLARTILGGNKRIHLIEPLDVMDFHNLAARSFFIMSDSGGVQEEAPSLGKPVLVLRNTTERPEGVSAGTLKLVGTETENIVLQMQRLLSDESYYSQMANANNPYGDGKASNRIAEAIKFHFNCIKNRPNDF